MRHQSQLGLVKEILERDGRIEAYDAVYRLTDRDGNIRRVTRLAAVIFTLRHDYGMDIETVNKPGKLATYILRNHVKPLSETDLMVPSGSLRLSFGEQVCRTCKGTGGTTKTPCWACSGSGKR